MVCSLFEYWYFFQKWMLPEHPAYEPIVTKVLQDALTEEPSSSAGKGEVRDWLKSLLDD